MKDLGIPIRPDVQLTDQATTELIEVLNNTIGKEAVAKLQAEEINHIGNFLLTLTATRLKIQKREQEKNMKLQKQEITTKTKFIFHGGETGRLNQHNANFYREWVATFDDDFIPTILLTYYAVEEDKWGEKEMQDKERFAAYTNNRKVNFIVAHTDLEIFKKQIEQADVIYVRGGSSQLVYEKMKPIKDEFLDLIQGKVYAGSSAGVMFLSHYARSHTTIQWQKFHGLLPIVSIVHWFDEYQQSLDEFKKEHNGKEGVEWEYLLIPETEFIIRYF